MPQPNTTCANCGEPMYAAPSRLKKYNGRVTCSMDCKWELNGAPRETCVICGKSVYKHPAVRETNNVFFCSRECYHIGLERGIGKNPRKPESTLTCEQCGKKFYRSSPNYRRGKHTFCSRQCSGKFRRDRKTYPCALCGEPVIRRPSEVQNEKQHAFCSREHAVMYQLNRTGPNGLETRFGQAFPRLRFVGDGRLWIQDETGFMNPDFILPGSNRLVELWGDYWHQDDDPSERIDRLRETGFETLIIMESDFDSDFERQQERVQVFLADAPETTDVTGIPCTGCGETLFVLPQQGAETVSFYCKACQDKLRDQVRRPKRAVRHNTACQTCGKPLYRKPGQLKKWRYAFCSRECHGIHKRKPPIKRTPNHTCDYCGNAFFRYDSQIKGGHVYCSTTCMGLHRRNKPQSDWKGD